MCTCVYFWDPHAMIYVSIFVLITVVLWYHLNTRSMIPLVLFFFKIALTYLLGFFVCAWFCTHFRIIYSVFVVQLLSNVWLFATPWTATFQASLSFTISQSFLKFMFITFVRSSSHLILWCPLLLLPSILFNIRDFSNESVICIRWPKYWSFRFSISPSNKYSRSISLKTHWFDLLAVQGTPRSLLQHHSLKASILQLSAFFMVQLSQPYTTTGEDHSLDCMYLCQKSNVSAFQHTV